jgi:hypothetical protein
LKRDRSLAFLPLPRPVDAGNVRTTGAHVNPTWNLKIRIGRRPTLRAHERD